MKLPAFQFYPGDWRKSRWVKIDPLGLFLPEKPACYVIFLDGKCSYIGGTSNLRKRFQNYDIRLGYGSSVMTPWGSFREVEVKAHFSVRLGDWAMREIRLIRRLQPRLNCVGSTAKRKTML